jgi:Zn-dependent alcohol dehydrogenase
LAREWIIGGKIDLAPLITAERRLEEGTQVLEDLRAGKGVKYVFKP